MSTSARGFTLVELLVVIAIVGILASIIAPALRTAKERAHWATCSNNLKQIGIALQMYLNDHDEIFPPCTDYASWRGQVGHGTNDIQRVLNDYIGFNDGTGTNNMGSKIWVCPSAARYGRRQPAGDDPYFVSASALTRSWGFHDMTYRWNANPTRDGNGLNGSLLTRAYPQSAKCLNQPSKAAILWDIPDNLPLFGMPLHNANVDRVNTLFVDGHVDYVPVVPGAWPADTLWWYVAYGPDQGWEGVLTKGNDPNT